jgi:hypothetical protein
MTKILSCAVVVGLLIATSSSVFARGGVNNGGTNASGVAPGHPSSTSVTPVQGLHGAAGYAPGQQMLHGTGAGAVPAPGNGAAVYAPGFLK